MKLSFCKHLVGVISLAALSTAIMAGTPTFQYVRTIDYSPHCCVGNVLSMVAAPNGSSLYFGDWFSDGIFYVATPLTSDGDTNDITNTLGVAEDIGTWESGWSFQRADIDGTRIYMGGASTTDTQLFVTVETSPGVSTTERITGIGGVYSGPAVVGPNKLVLGNLHTGALQFMTVSGTTATSDGVEIANPNNGTAKTLSVAYDAPSGKIFSYMVDDNLTRRIDVFNSNGTPAGTTYQGTWIAGAPGSLLAIGTSTSTSHNRSSQISIDNKYRIMIVPFRDNTSDGWDVFDISTVGVTGTPYAQIRVGDFSDTDWTGTARDINSAARFVSSGEDYLALGYYNELTVLKIQPASEVSGWTLY